MNALEQVYDMFGGGLKICVREKNTHAPEDGYKHWDLPPDGDFYVQVDGVYDRMVIMHNGKPVYAFTPSPLPTFLTSGSILRIQPEVVAEIVHHLIDAEVFVDLG